MKKTIKFELIRLFINRRLENMDQIFDGLTSKRVCIVCMKHIGQTQHIFFYLSNTHTALEMAVQSICFLSQFIENLLSNRNTKRLLITTCVYLFSEQANFRCFIQTQVIVYVFQRCYYL